MIGITKKFRACGTVVILQLLLTFFLGEAFAEADFNLPQTAEVDLPFVVDVNLPDGIATPARVTYDPKLVQFFGPIVSTPEVQMVSDGRVEIHSEGGRPGAFGLRFLALPGTLTASFAMELGATREEKILVFQAVKSKGGYSLLILVSGVFLLVLGWKIWQVQKKHPSLMSTRSLFMNFEALEKIRHEYFPPATNEGNSPPKAEPGKDLLPPKQQEVPPANAEPPVKELAVSTKVTAPPAPQGKPLANSTVGRTVSKDFFQIPANQPSKDMSKTLVDAPVSIAQPRGDTPKTVVDEPVPVSILKPNPLQDSVEIESEKTFIRDISDRTDLPGETNNIFVKIVDDRGREFTGRGPQVSIGRKKGNIICLSSAEVSRNHVEIKLDPTGFVVVPLSQSNLTALNGTRITNSAPIKVGDELSLGGTIFKILELTLG